MPAFSERSKAKLAECHPLIQLVMERAIQSYDFTIIEGHRNQDRQDAAFHAGRSKLKWPNSKHNQFPSLAIDIAPWQLGKAEMRDREEIIYMAGRIQGVAEVLGIPLRWGGDWDGDNLLSNNGFDDLFHFELEA